jgi:biotin carboxyl carrier protein
VVYELRAARAGTVTGILVDEGQMVAEEDEIATLATTNGPVSVFTDVPGVVREIYAVAGGTVDAGSVIALIDES